MILTVTEVLVGLPKGPNFSPKEYSYLQFIKRIIIQYTGCKLAWLQILQVNRSSVTWVYGHLDHLSLSILAHFY